MPALIGGLIFLIAAVWAIVQDMVRVFVQPIVNTLNSLDPNIPMTPADAADGVVRTRWDYAEGYAMASSSGISDTVFTNMVALVGEPPPLNEMLALYERGVIDEATLQEMYQYSRARNEWYAAWKASYHSTMSTADALEARLKGVVSDEQAQQWFNEAGGLPDQYATLLETTGNPIGVVAAGNLYNHKLISHEALQQVILHSRVNPQFEPMAELQRFHWLAPFQIMQVIKAGAAPIATVTEWLTELGYPADQIAGIVKEGSTTKTAVHKSLAESQVVTLYESGVIGEAEATTDLENLGYDPGESAFILAIYDQKKRLTFIEAVVTQTRKGYLSYRIAKDQATQIMTALGINPSTITNYLAIWDVEAAAEVRSLTMAQIGAMYKKGLFDDTEAVQRWEMMGYSEADAALLLADYGGPPPAGTPAAQTPTGG